MSIAVGNGVSPVFPSSGFGGGSPVRSYAQILVEDFGANEVWPLVDIASGTTINAYVNAARNGTLTGWDLQNAVGPVPGTLAPFGDGTNDIGNVFSASLAGIGNFNIGSMLVWCKMTLAVWGGSAFGIMFELRTNGAVFTFITKDNAANRLYWQHGGTTIQRPTTNFSTNNWFMVGLSWNNTIPERKAYYNGVQVGATITSAFNIVTAIDAATISARIGGTLDLTGHIAYPSVKFGSTWTPTNMLDIYNAAATAGPD